MSNTDALPVPKTRRPHVTFSATGVPDAVAILDAAPVVVDNYGNWTMVQRQRRVSLTQWEGKDPLQMTIAILFDGWVDQTSQELAISHLSRMALPQTSGSEPPVVSVKGPGVPKPGPLQWVIHRLSWGANVILQGGLRYRQDCVVTLLQYVAEDRVAFGTLSPGVINGSSKSGWPKTYIVQKGDTLQVVAAKFYNDSTKWHKIADANSIRDPRNLVGVTTLTIPAP